MKIKSSIFIFFIILFISFGTANALTITHPETTNETVNEAGIFFSGKIDKYEKVFINGIQMHPAKKGAFSYSFRLKEGENIFAVQKKDFFFYTETLSYKITRISAKQDEFYNKFMEIEPSYYITTRDNVVLRSTPLDEGMNRLGYLPQGTKVYVDGTQNEFSRIYLAKDKFGWAFTKDLEKSKENLYNPVQILDSNQLKNDKEITTVIELSENCPYSAVVEDNKLIVTIYNLDNSSETFSKEFRLDKFPRYSICLQNNILYITQKKNPINKTYSNKDIKIIIDAGHGGTETGAVGCLGDKEKTLNLEVALKLKKILEEHHFNVKLTREFDKFISLNDRIDYAKNEDALIFISIHLNSVPISDDPNLNQGTVVFYFNPQSKELAKCLSKNVSQELHSINGGATQTSFAVIRPTEYIGALVELAYLVNPQDVKIYKNKKFAQSSAEGIYKGLANYIHSEIEK